MPADPATRATMQDNDQKPKKRRDAPVSEPGVVREPPARALMVPRAGPHKRSDTANLATADGARDEAPRGPADIREEGQTEGDGVEHESLEARDGTRIQQPFDPTRIKISTREPSVDLVMKRIRRGRNRSRTRLPEVRRHLAPQNAEPPDRVHSPEDPAARLLHGGGS